MNQLVVVAVLAAISLGIVSATVSFLFWRNPMLQKSVKIGVAIASVLLSLLLTLGLTSMYNKYVVKANRPKASTGIDKTGQSVFMYGYRVLDDIGGSRILVGKNITREDLEVVLKMAARDLAQPSSAFSALAFSAEDNNGGMSDPSFVAEVSADRTGKAKILWSPGLQLPGEKPTL